jgi:hypothetical protein
MNENNSGSGDGGVGAIILLILLFSPIAAPFLGALAVIAGVLVITLSPILLLMGLCYLLKSIPKVWRSDKIEDCSKKSLWVRSVDAFKEGYRGG